MRQHQSTITVTTRGAGLYEFTGDVERAVVASGIESGLLTLFCQHTSASLIIQENADPDVQHDLLAFFRRLVPEGMDWVTHDAEGPDDMPAHIRAALTQTSLTVPLADGRPVLGTWQGIYLFEHRRRPHRRNVVLHLLGE